MNGVLACYCLLSGADDCGAGVCAMVWPPEKAFLTGGDFFLVFSLFFLFSFLSFKFARLKNRNYCIVAYLGNNFTLGRQLSWFPWDGFFEEGRGAYYGFLLLVRCTQYTGAPYIPIPLEKSLPSWSSWLRAGPSLVAAQSMQSYGYTQIVASVSGSIWVGFLV